MFVSLVIVLTVHIWIKNNIPHTHTINKQKTPNQKQNPANSSHFVSLELRLSSLEMDTVTRFQIMNDTVCISLFMLMPLENAVIHLFPSRHFMVNRTEWVLKPCCDNWSRRKKALNSHHFTPLRNINLVPHSSHDGYIYIYIYIYIYSYER